MFLNIWVIFPLKFYLLYLIIDKSCNKQEHGFRGSYPELTSNLLAMSMNLGSTIYTTSEQVPTTWIMTTRSQSAQSTINIKSTSAISTKSKLSARLRPHGFIVSIAIFTVIPMLATPYYKVSFKGQHTSSPVLAPNLVTSCLFPYNLSTTLQWNILSSAHYVSSSILPVSVNVHTHLAAVMYQCRLSPDRNATFNQPPYKSWLPLIYSTSVYYWSEPVTEQSGLQSETLSKIKQATTKP